MQFSVLDHTFTPLCTLWVYCSKEDVPWLVDTLWKKRGNGNRNLDIEVDHGFKLFIHHRDFVAGNTIMSNIQNGIEKSRRVIFILSK